MQVELANEIMLLLVLCLVHAIDMLADCVIMIVYWAFDKQGQSYEGKDSSPTDS